MTTNQTIDGVSREQVERTLDAIEQVGLQDKFIDYTFVRAVKHELRAILDAPAVERKPFGYWRVPKSLPLQGAFFPWIEGQSEQDVKNALEHEFGFSVKLLYDTPAAQPQGEPVPITGDMNRLMDAYKAGEFSLEGGSETVEALSVASFDAVESHGHDADSYMSGYCAALYEQAKPFIWLALQPKAEQPAPVAVVMPERSNAVASANVSAKQAYALGWNACLDEVTRLNKSPT